MVIFSGLVLRGASLDFFCHGSYGQSALLIYYRDYFVRSFIGLLLYGYDRSFLYFTRFFRFYFGDFCIVGRSNVCYLYLCDFYHLFLYRLDVPPMLRWVVFVIAIFMAYGFCPVKFFLYFPVAIGDVLIHWLVIGMPFIGILALFFWRRLYAFCGGSFFLSDRRF